MLKDSEFKKAKPKKGRQYKLADGEGLSLLVKPNGGKYWRMKYRHNGKEKTLALGVYPDVTLKMARDRKTEARRLLADGVDPGAAKKAEKAATRTAQANTFEAIAREWHAKKAPTWAPSHAEKTIRRLEQHVFPWLGTRPMREVDPPTVLEVLERIEKKSAETAKRASQTIGQVCRYAIATRRAERDPTPDLRGALTPYRPKHFPAPTDPKRVGELLRMIHGHAGTFAVGVAIKLAPMIFVRPGELRQAKWEEIDLEAAEWSYLVTKTKTQHIVPLSTQALNLLRDLHPLTGHGDYVFPSARAPKGDKPMSDAALLAAYRRQGIGKEELSTHGWRATARTLLDEVLGYPPHIIEHQLAHAVKDPNGRAYNRTAHLPQRKAMMQSWSDYLDRLRTGADVIQLPAKRAE